MHCILLYHARCLHHAGPGGQAGRTTARDALTSQRTATVPAASSQSLLSAAQTDSTATSPEKGPAAAQKDPYNKGHKVHRKRSGETRADKVLHSVESMQQQQAKRQATQTEASQQGLQYMAQQMAFGMVQVRPMARFKVSCSFRWHRWQIAAHTRTICLHSSSTDLA